MLVAAIVVLALALAYLLCAPRAWRVRLGHLFASGVVLVAVAGAWIAAVALTPAASRPWISGTSDNSALSLAFGYNGIGRVDGQAGGTSFGGRGGGGGAFAGAPGFFRLLNDSLGDQAAWLLPLAFVGCTLAIFLALRGRDRARLGVLLLLGGWLVTAAAVFSYASGIVHTYYTSALAPAVAALVGAGSVAPWRAARRGGVWAGPACLAVAATAALEVVLLRRSGYLPWLQTVVIAAATIAVSLLVAAAFGKRLPWARSLASRIAIAVAVVAFLAAPAAWAETTLEGPVNGVFPGAGPSFVSGLATTGGGFGFGGGPRFGNGRTPAFGNGPPPGFGNGQFPGRGGAPQLGNGGFGGGGGDASQALAYARTHSGTKRFTLIVSGAASAANEVIQGDAIGAIGGFSGRESSESTAFIARLVQNGDARYFLLGGAGFGGAGGPGGRADNRRDVAAQVIQSTCTSVFAVSGLYDCAGKAQAIATSVGG
jgi:hypothetical protein